jgi:hypothetical protein
MRPIAHARRSSQVAAGWVTRALDLFSDGGELITTYRMLAARNTKLLWIMLISWPLVAIFQR